MASKERARIPELKLAYSMNPPRTEPRRFDPSARAVSEVRPKEMEKMIPEKKTGSATKTAPNA